MLQRRHGCSEHLNIFFLHASDNLCELGEFPRAVGCYHAGVRNGMSSRAC
jgi:hypothetical protein